MINIRKNVKKTGIRQRKLDMDDRQRIRDELQIHSHPLTDHSDILYNIVNGQVASAEMLTYAMQSRLDKTCR